MTGKASTALAIIAVAALSGCSGTDVASNGGMTYTDKGWAYNEVVQEDWKTAEAKLASEVEQHPGDPFRLLNLAYVYTKTEKSEDAIAVYQKVLDLESDSGVSSQDLRAKKIARDALASMVDTK